MSGATWSPKNSSSSPVLTITVRRRGSIRRTRPRRNLAAPTPPASVVIVGFREVRDGPRAIGSLSAVELAISGGAFDGSTANLRAFLLDQIDRQEFPRRAARLRRDALFHQRAGEIVASGVQR